MRLDGRELEKPERPTDGFSSGSSAADGVSLLGSCYGAACRDTGTTVSERLAPRVVCPPGAAYTLRSAGRAVAPRSFERCLSVCSPGT